MPWGRLLDHVTRLAQDGSREDGDSLRQGQELRTASAGLWAPPVPVQPAVSK